MADQRLLAWLRRAQRAARITASVCSGAFLLAAAGILDGKRAATHWSACERLALAFPKVTVDANAIFVRDGSVWSSAGVTTGIDMALAIVEADHGADLVDKIAAQLVLYVRRPGFQSQFSEALVAQTRRDDSLGPAIAWARGNLERCDVERLAHSAGLSVRTLHRRCLETLATTPARLIEKLRVERARALIDTHDLPSKRLAISCGFGSTARLNRAFIRELGLLPRAYKVLHASR
jgi:transcriptional regulator GlxA family with amidase domain